MTQPPHTGPNTCALPWDGGKPSLISMLTAVPTGGVHEIVYVEPGVRTSPCVGRGRSVAKLVSGQVGMSETTRVAVSEMASVERVRKILMRIRSCVIVQG